MRRGRVANSFAAIGKRSDASYCHPAVAELTVAASLAALARRMTGDTTRSDTGTSQTAAPPVSALSDESRQQCRARTDRRGTERAVAAYNYRPAVAKLTAGSMPAKGRRR